MKYTKEQYEETILFDGEEDIRNHKQKLVKVRKEHTCCICGETIKKGEYAICETGIMDDEGYVSAYTCIKCADEWIDEIGAY